MNSPSKLENGFSSTPQKAAVSPVYAPADLRTSQNASPAFEFNGQQGTTANAATVTGKNFPSYFNNQISNGEKPCQSLKKLQTHKCPSTLFPSANGPLDESHQSDRGPTPGKDSDRKSRIPDDACETTPSHAQAEPHRDKCSAPIGHWVPRKCRFSSPQCRGAGATFATAAAVTRWSNRCCRCIISFVTIKLIYEFRSTIEGFRTRKSLNCTND